MNSHPQIIAGGGQNFGGKPLTTLFAILTLTCLTGLILCIATLYHSETPLKLSSGLLWVCLLLGITDLGLLILTIKFSLTEKKPNDPGPPHDLRKLY